jgi:orotate phosphoribosyltransferase
MHYYKEELLKKFKKYNVVKYGMFRLSSGIISDKKVVLDKAIQDPVVLELIVNLMEMKIGHMSLRRNLKGFDVLVGQKSNGDIVAEALAKKLDCDFVAYDKNNFTVGEHDLMYKTCWLIDDVWTTGRSIRSQCAWVEAQGSHAIGATVIVSRNIPKLTNYLVHLDELLK